MVWNNFKNVFVRKLSVFLSQKLKLNYYVENNSPRPKNQWKVKHKPFNLDHMTIKFYGVDQEIKTRIFAW